MMKQIIALLSLIVIGGNTAGAEIMEKFVEKLRSLGQECIEETHASDDDISELIAQTNPSTHEGKCLFFCMQKKLHMMNEDGSLDKVGSVLALETFREDPEMYKKVLTLFVTCGETAKIFDDPCETSTGLAMCVRDEWKKSGMGDSLFG